MDEYDAWRDLGISLGAKDRPASTNGHVESKDTWALTSQRDLTGFVLGAGGITGRPAYPRQNIRNWTAEGYRKNELVFGCIAYMARTASQPTIRAYAKSRVGGKLQILPDEAAANQIIVNSRPRTSEAWFLSQLIVQDWVAGNAIALIRRDVRDNLPIELHWLRGDRIKRTVDGADRITEYAYVMQGVEFPIRPENVFHHLFAFDPSDPSWGLSPLAVLARRVTVDNTATDFVASFFANAAVPYGMLTTEQALLRPEADEIASRWEERYSGLEGWHRPAVLGRGAKYERLGLNMAEMAMPDLTAVSEARICMDLFVPPILVGAKVGLDRSTYSNYGEARLALWEDTAQPTYDDVADAFTDQLGPEFGDLITYKVDYSQVPALREAIAARFERARGGWNDGLLSRNEARQAAGLDPLPTDAMKQRITEEIIELTPEQEAQPATGAIVGRVKVDEADPLVEAKHGARVAHRRYAGATYRRGVDRLRATLVPRIKARLEQFVDALGDRVMSRAQAGAFRPAAAKAKPFVGRAAQLLRQTDIAELERILTAYFDAVGGETISVANLAYDLGLLYQDSPARLATLARAARDGQKIVDTLVDDMERRMAVADRRSWSVSKLVDGEAGEAGLAGVFGKGDPRVDGFLSALDRAERIAQSSFTTAANISSSAAFKAGGVEQVIVHDGSGLGDRCDEIDGQVWTVDEASADELEHPNCTRIFEPILPGEGEEAA